MLKKWINPKYLNEKEISGIRNKFFKSKPYPNFNLPDFFNKNKLTKLRNESLASRKLYAKDHHPVVYVDELTGLPAPFKEESKV